MRTAAPFAAFALLLSASLAFGSAPTPELPLADTYTPKHVPLIDLWVVLRAVHERHAAPRVCRPAGAPAPKRVSKVVRDGQQIRFKSEAADTRVLLRLAKALDANAQPQAKGAPLGEVALWKGEVMWVGPIQADAKTARAEFARVRKLMIQAGPRADVSVLMTSQPARVLVFGERDAVRAMAQP